MLHFLPEIKKVFKIIAHETNELEILAKRVNEMLIDDLMKDLTLHRTPKISTADSFLYEVHKDDYEHICEYLVLIQNYLTPDVVVTLQNSNDDYRVIFKVIDRS
jgi:hypothetical protein